MFQGSVEHALYTDDSGSGSDRFRSIAALSGTRPNLDKLEEDIRHVLRDSGLSNLEWKEITGSSDRTRAAFGLVETVLRYASEERIRVDVLVYDTHDSRHCVKGRDDTGNLYRMYYHLICHAIRRWGVERWSIFRDEASDHRWSEVEHYLEKTKMVSSKRGTRLRLLHGDHYIDIVEVAEVQSHLEPLIQVADIFAGIGRYWREKAGDLTRAIEDLKLQESRRRGHQLLIDEEPADLALSRADKARTKVIDNLLQVAERLRLGVRLAEDGCFKTSPSCPVNFWLYSPQSERDKSPTKLIKDFKAAGQGLINRGL